MSLRGLPRRPRAGTFRAKGTEAAASAALAEKLTRGSEAHASALPKKVTTRITSTAITSTGESRPSAETALACVWFSVSILAGPGASFPKPMRAPRFNYSSKLTLSKSTMKLKRAIPCSIVALLLGASAAAAAPLESWKETGSRKAIVSFVEKTTRTGSPDFIPVPERIAVFDNDGTLWSEQPMYFQLAFLIDQVKAQVPQHPEWKEKEPFASLLKGDLKGVEATGVKGLLELAAATHAGMTTEEFEKKVKDWLAAARHPKTGKPYTEMVFQPMVELLAYLRENGYKTFIVSGGGIEFMRPWTEKVYGIPPEQVVGSSLKLKYEVKDGKPVIMKLPELDFIDDKEGKPVGIQNHIGRRPVFAAGNSDGDFQMLEWTTTGSGPRFGLLVHHDDAEREYAYDRHSAFGKLDRGLDEGPKRGWSIVSMKEDWNSIFAGAASK